MHATGDRDFLAFDPVPSDTRTSECLAMHRNVQSLLFTIFDFAFRTILLDESRDGHRDVEFVRIGIWSAWRAFRSGLGSQSLDGV